MLIGTNQQLAETCIERLKDPQRLRGHSPIYKAVPRNNTNHVHVWSLCICRWRNKLFSQMVISGRVPEPTQLF